MKCATNRLTPKWNSPDHGESWTENHLHSGHKPTCRTTTIVPTHQPPVHGIFVTAVWC